MRDAFFCVMSNKPKKTIKKKKKRVKTVWVGHLVGLL